MDSIIWDDYVCENDMLTQDEFEKMLQGNNEFAPLEGYGAQPMDTNGFAPQGDNSVQPMELTTAGYGSLLVDQFLTSEQLSALSAPANTIPYFSLEELDQIVNQPLELAQGQFDIFNTQPMDMTDYSQLTQQAQTFPEGGDFNGIFNNDCFGAVQFTSPMAQNLDQIATEPIDYQNTFGSIFQENTFESSAVDPNMFSLAVDPAYIYNYPTETIANQAQGTQQNFEFENSALFEDLFDENLFVPQLASLFPLEENLNFQPDDLELFGEDEIIASAPKQLFLPAPAVAPTRPRTSRKALPASATVAGPSTPTRAVRKPLVEVSPLKCAGQIKVINEIKKSGEKTLKMPYKYTVYKPLRPWGKVKYNARGYLHEAIRFDAREMNDFLSNHPLGPKLVLRIGKHPYEMKQRETGRPQYMRCRADNCSISGDNRFMVGDLRVAIDEVTGRFGPDDVENNCPYFAAGFIHLECLEHMVDLVPLVSAGILIPDRREILPNEPEKYTKYSGNCNNKMALVKKQIVEYERWAAAHPAGSKRAEGKRTLNVAMWISGQRSGRIRARFPPGVKAADVTKWISDNRYGQGWGGRRMAGGTVVEMEMKIAAGKEHEIIAPRNGLSGKRGMNIGGVKKQPTKRRHTELESESELGSSSSSSSDSDSDSPAPRHKQKKRRTNNKKAAVEPPRSKKQRGRRSSIASMCDSPGTRLTYFNSAATPPKKTREPSQESVQEISAEQARVIIAPRRRMSTRIKKEVMTYILSDDDDSEKENRDPTYSKFK